MPESLGNSVNLVQQIFDIISDVFAVDDSTSDFPQPGAVRFRGRLMIPVNEAYAKLNPRFEPYHLIPVIRRVGDQDVLLALPATDRAEVPVGRPWLNIVLFLATVLTVLMAGVQQDTGNFLADILSGWPFAAGLLCILLTHEFGHYFAAQYHGVAATLPYFIPMPFSLLGTFGAVISIKSPIRDRKALLDIGAAGPLAGLIVAVPILLVGLALSPVDSLAHCTAENPCLMEGNSLLYLGAKLLVKGQVLPSNGVDVMLHPLAFAGWVGILVTSLNLLPVGTLDGGHVAFALLGNKARRFYLPALATLIGLGFLWDGWWLWSVLLLLFGRMRAQPLDDATPLDGKRKLVAVASLLIFVLTFTPLPMEIFW
jgi:Zn-dependent protease